MSRPTISIVTATLNALPDLSRTIASVDEQAFRDFEHIVIDGGSTDGTIQALAERPDIRSISEPDEGISDAMNKGVGLAGGEWVLVLHAGDTLIDESALSDAAPYLNTGSEIVSFDVLYGMDSGDRVWKSTGLRFKTNFKTTVPHQGAFTRRSLIYRLGGFDSRFETTMDYDLLLRAYRADVEVDVVNNVLAYMPDTGISSRRDWASLRARFEEERAIHRLHAQTPVQKAVYAVYWPLYLAYRRIRVGSGIE